jgi:hypothetical protein
MRVAICTTVVLVLLLAIYIASPLVALYRIGSAVEAKDAAALEERTDFPSVRRSFEQQIVATYRKLTGKTLPLNAMAKRLAVSVADPIVARLMTINALLDLLGKGEAGTKAKVPIDRAPLTSRSLDNVWRVWLNSEYLGRTFYVYLPPDGRMADKFRVKLRFSNWYWRIAGIELPDELTEKLAKELIKFSKDKFKVPNRDP